MPFVSPNYLGTFLLSQLPLLISSFPGLKLQGSMEFEEIVKYNKFIAKNFPEIDNNAKFDFMASKKAKENSRQLQRWGHLLLL